MRQGNGSADSVVFTMILKIRQMVITEAEKEYDSLSGYQHEFEMGLAAVNSDNSGRRLYFVGRNIGTRIEKIGER